MSKIDIDFDLKAMMDAERIQDNILEAVQKSMPFDSAAYVAAAANTYLMAFKTHTNSSDVRDACAYLYAMLDGMENELQ